MSVFVSDIAAGAAIEKGQIVKISAGKWVPASANADAAKGVAVQSASAESLVKVCVEGECDVLVGTALTLFGGFTSNANGAAEPADSSSLEVTSGFAFETGAVGSYARVTVLANKPVAAV